MSFSGIDLDQMRCEMYVMGSQLQSSAQNNIALTAKLIMTQNEVATEHAALEQLRAENERLKAASTKPADGPAPEASTKP